MILSFGPVLNVPLRELKQMSVNGHASPTQQDTLEEAQRKHILKVLEDAGWVLGGSKGAAARLGLNRSTLQFRMRKMGISRTGQSSPKAATP